MKRSSIPALRFGLAACLALAAALVAPPSGAQSAKEIAAARQAFKDGEAAEARGDLVTALASFQAALAVKETAQLHLRIGTVQEKLGRLVDALASYQRGLDRATGMPPVVKVAREQIAAVQPRIPTVTLRVTAPPAGLVVTLDGAPLTATSLGAATPIDPGRHQVHAEAPGRAPFDRTFTADRGDTRLELDLAPTAVKPTAAPPSRVPGAVVTAGGAAALVAGAVLIGLSVAKDGSIDALCGGSERLTCPESRRAEIESDVRSVNALRFGGIGAGVVGAAGVAVGAVLLVRAARPREPAAGSFHFQVTPLAGAGTVGLGVHGSFR